MSESVPSPNNMEWWEIGRLSACASGLLLQVSRVEAMPGTKIHVSSGIKIMPAEHDPWGFIACNRRVRVPRWHAQDSSNDLSPDVDTPTNNFELVSSKWDMRNAWSVRLSKILTSCHTRSSFQRISRRLTARQHITCVAKMPKPFTLTNTCCHDGMLLHYGEI